VVGEPLPHLGHEESGQSAGVAEEGLLGSGGTRADRILRQAGRHGRSSWVGTRQREGARARWGEPAPAGRAVHPTPGGVRSGSRSGGRRPPGSTPSARCCARQARQQVVPSGTGGEGTRTGPHTKETFSVECAKGLHGATGVGSPYGRTQPDMEGFETRITGFGELRSPIRRSLH